MACGVKMLGIFVCKSHYWNLSSGWCLSASGVVRQRGAAILGHDDCPSPLPDMLCAPVLKELVGLPTRPMCGSRFSLPSMQHGWIQTHCSHTCQFIAIRHRMCAEFSELVVQVACRRVSSLVVQDRVFVHFLRSRVDWVNTVSFLGEHLLEFFFFFSEPNHRSQTHSIRVES